MQRRRPGSAWDCAVAAATSAAPAPPRAPAVVGKGIVAIVFFVKRRVGKHGNLKKEAIERSAEKLTLILPEKYKTQWYPEKPSKGQAYRCIRVSVSEWILMSWKPVRTGAPRTWT